MDPVFLSRIQFAANISFHILFPTITIALAWVLLYFKLRFNRSGEAHWMAAYRFWVKVFALSFALGVVSGVTMSFQFGTNWPGFMQKVGNIAGPLLAYEVLTAFFLEATFLAIMLFGTERVSNRMHTLATVLVAAGTTFSAFWILALNSWMHTPAGFEMRDGVAHATDWWAVVFNPSLPYRLAHMLIASGLTAAFLVAGISAYRWLRGDRKPDVLAAMRTGTYLAAVLIPVQILVGDLHGLNSLEHQPAKVAAMEGLWKTERGAAAVLFGFPDEQAAHDPLRDRDPEAGLALPGAQLGRRGQGPGRVREAPPVAPVFFAFRVMVGVGVLMLLVSWVTALRLYRAGEPATLHARALVAMTFAGWLAVLAGWYTTEIGRQPWLVEGVLTTAEAATTVPGSMVALSLAMYLVLYAALLTAYLSVLFYLARKASDGGVAEAPVPGAGAPALPREGAHA